jgi:hypothetical protein
MKLDPLLLQTGEDIPFSQARLTIHQPRLKEISYMGETNFHIGSQFLLFDKNKLPSEDILNLEDQSNFNIFMSVMNSRDRAIHKTDALMILALLFPEAKLEIEADKILLQFKNFSSSINVGNFHEFQYITAQMSCLAEGAEDGQYNPADKLAQRIADKLKKRKEKAAKAKGENLENVSIYAKYISILSVGLKKDKNELKEYTIPQIRDEFERFVLKQNFDVYLEAKMAGAQDLEEVKNWMEDL